METKAKGLTVLVIIVVCSLMVQVAAQPTPFLISGWVKDSNGNPVNNPTVNINNTNTSNEWHVEAEAHADYNYYQLILGTTNVSDGDVLEFNATDGTRYNTTNHTVTQENITDGGIFNFNITLGAPAPKIVINEFLANPSTGNDWVELYNPMDTDVSLNGWTIKDGVGNLLDLTGETAPANGYLVFDFSNKLNKNGDIIYLNKSTTTVDKVAYGNWNDGNIGDNAPKPGDDQSAGRHPNGMDTNNDSADFRVFDIPTPGASNTIAPEITGFAPSTYVSDDEGESRTFNITIDQTVDVVWKINGTQVQPTNTSVTEASYTNTSAVAGYWEVTATASNENGTVTQTWWWTVNDTTAPYVVPNSNSPTGTNVDITENITATFSEPMNSSTLNTSTVLVENNTGTISGDVTYESATKTVTFDPLSNLEYNETYNVTITMGVEDLAGNNLTDDFTWNFTTCSEVMEATISIGNASANPGNTTIVPMMIYNAINVGVIDVNLTYNQSVVIVIDATEGDFDTGAIPNLEHNGTGSVRIGAFQTYNPGLNGSVIIANVTLKALGDPGSTSPLNISVNEFKDATPKGNDIPYKVSNGTFTVNIPPIADAGLDQVVLVNETVQFNASGSYDPDGEIVSYYWDFGDGTNATGVTPTHVYTVNGTYTVTLTVTDNDGATDSDTCNITVNIPPVADAGPDQTVLVNENVQFNGSGSYDSDGEIVSYFWDFGDGTNATGVTVTHIYAINGTFIVTLNVTDNNNATDEDIGNITAYWNGDANGDGKVELFDAMYLAKSVLEITGFEAIAITSDVNDDGNVTLHDAMYLAKHVLEISGFEELK